MTKSTTTKANRNALDAAAFIAASKTSLVDDIRTPDLNVISGGKVHEIPNSEISRFYVELTKGDVTHTNSEFVILANDALNNISNVGHYYKRANAYVNLQGKIVCGLPWHTDQLNHERSKFMVGLIETLVHVECGIAELKQSDESFATSYGHATNGRHNPEFVGIARKYFDTFIKIGDVDPATGLIATKKRENFPLKLNAKTQRFVDSFKFDESKFTLTLVIPTVEPPSELPQKALRLTCETHNKFVISVPVATQNATNDDKTPVRYRYSCDVVTSKNDATTERTCNKVLIAKA